MGGLAWVDVTKVAQNAAVRCTIQLASRLWRAWVVNELSMRTMLSLGTTRARKLTKPGCGGEWRGPTYNAFRALHCSERMGLERCECAHRKL